MKFGLYARKSSEDAGKQVQSIEDQVATFRDKASREGFAITKIYTESRSAKIPGRREQFNQMLEDLRGGIIDGVVTWKLDRLSRNQQEGGLIMQMLQDEVIKKIITYDKTYFPSDNGLLMTIELGMATEYSRALAENTKRGQRFKVKKGWYPSVAPLGYINTIDRIKGEKEIHPDPDRFSLVRRCWDLILDGMTVPEVWRESKKLGLKVPASRSKSEKYLSLHGIYNLLRNSFYYGHFQWDGELYRGNHQPMITKEEFDRTQDLIRGRSRPKMRKYNFPYTGMISCGHCLAAITAAPKDKVRKNGSVNHRIYYRCTRRKVGIECNQKAIRKEELEKQIIEILDSVSIPESFIKWAIQWLKDNNEESITKEKAVLNQQKKSLEKIDDQLQRLLDMHLDELIDSDTFKTKNGVLLAEKRQISKHIELGIDSQGYRIDKTIEVFEFCKNVRNMFDDGSYELRKRILDTLGSHWTLLDGKLNVELDPAYEAIAKLAKESWINDSRFPTLPTRIEPEFDAETCALIINGGGGEVLPPSSKNTS